MSRQVTMVQLHDVIHIPGLGQFDKSLNIPSKKLADFKMMLEDGGHITVTYTEGKYTKEFIVGAAMIKAAVLVPYLTKEEPKVQVKK